MSLLKEYYLPPVLESNARKGYIVPSYDIMLAALLAYISTRVKTRGFIFKKAAEKLVSLMTLYYPIDIMCIDAKCMAINPVTREIIKDHGVIGSLAFMLKHPSLKPYLEPYIEIKSGQYSYSEETYIEEYSIPPLKTGPARYYIGYNVFLLSGDTERVIIEPPLYYMVGYPMTKQYFRVFESLKKYISTIPYSSEKLVLELNKYRDFLQNPHIRISIEEGLKKLYELKVLTPGDTLYILTLIE